MTLIRIENLGDVPLIYDRDPVANYGVRGYRVRPLADDQFAVELDTAFQQLFQEFDAHGLGPVREILYGGIARTGTGRSYHHSHRAFDLDALKAESGFTWVANTFPSRPHFYLAIESVLRQNFGTVLTYDFDPSHRDHFHFDNGTSVGFVRHSKSRVLFLQNAAKYLFDYVVSVDGVWGPETESLERSIRQELAIGPITQRENWIALLDACVDIALVRAIESDPEELVA